jgi:hypothetical protein
LREKTEMGYLAIGVIFLGIGIAFLFKDLSEKVISIFEIFTGNRKPTTTLGRIFAAIIYILAGLLWIWPYSDSVKG